jgi:hypothetical protein
MYLKLQSLYIRNEIPNAVFKDKPKGIVRHLMKVDVKNSKDRLMDYI